VPLVTEVKVFSFRHGELRYIPKGWDVFNAELDEGMLYVYARRGVHYDPPEEEPTPGLKP